MRRGSGGWSQSEAGRVGAWQSVVKFHVGKFVVRTAAYKELVKKDAVLATNAPDLE